MDVRVDGCMDVWMYVCVRVGGPREAQVALTRGRRPRRRAHADTREGRHVAGRLAGGGLTSIVGP